MKRTGVYSFDFDEKIHTLSKTCFASDGDGHDNGASPPPAERRVFVTDPQTGPLIRHPQVWPLTLIFEDRFL